MCSDLQMSTRLSILAAFVTPAFALAGLLLASIPLIIHLLNRRRYKVVSWAAMEFLLQAMRKNRRRLRFESWLLLAMRCLVLALLGLALSRPLGCQSSTLAAMAGQRSGLHVIVIDNAYSMGYEADRPDAKTQLDQAKKLAKGLIDRLAPGSESVAIITSGKPAVAITPSPIFDLQAAKSAVDRIALSFSSTDLQGALTLAQNIATTESRQPNKSLYLLDDSTRSTWQGPTAQSVESLGRALGAVYHITHYDLSRPGQWNHAVIDLHPVANLTRVGFPNDFAATVHGYGSSPQVIANWKLDGQPLPGAKSLTPQPDSEPITLGDAPIKEGGPHVISLELASDNRLNIDDTRNRVVDVASELKVLIVEGERGIGPLDGSGAFLQLALSPPSDTNTGGQPRSTSYVSAERISDLEFPTKVLSNYRAVILAGVGQISPQEGDQLKAFVEQGGSLMLFMGDAVSGDSYNQSLLTRGLLPGPLTKRIGDMNGQKTYLFDFKPKGNLDPLLHAFAGQENTGLETAQVYAYWQVDLSADGKARRVLNYLPDEKSHVDPAITVQDVGRGRVVFFSTSANAAWTSFPAKPAYITLIHEMIAGTVSSGDAWMNLTVGDSLEIPPTLALTTAPTLKDPQQVEVVLTPPTDATASYRSKPLARPGLYTLTTGVRRYPIAVNVPAVDEADIRPVNGDAIRKAMGDVDVNLESDQLPAEEMNLAAGNDYGWSIMLIVLSILGCECLLALRMGHYKR